MKKEIHPGVFIAVLVLLIGGAVVAFMMSGAGATDKVDIKTLDPSEFKDEDPPRRGEPGYRERITDPVGE